ncbi:MAG: CPBP family intramembrane metalloprotease [Sandaracinaceae bacterium]|nr:CPBP family intramembrane metalloprotease [Sandaracinaceae bacterium]MDW8246894.1 CPBP family intramembrane glutamic endopeptidase [Sandaracinaceae bacterium]
MDLTERDQRELQHFRLLGRAGVGFGIVLFLLGLWQNRSLPFELGIALMGGGIALFVFSNLKIFQNKLLEIHPRRFFLETWIEIDREAQREPLPFYDFRPLWSLIVGAVCLSVMEYFGHTVHFVELANAYAPQLKKSPFFELMGFAWWSLFRVFGYFVIPLLVVVFIFREPIREYGLETDGWLEHAWIYATSFIIVLVCVILVARHHPHFQVYYPFYKLCGRSWLDLMAWELMYAAQFFSLEFFFRGFWLKAMKATMGSQAIFAMVVPYCMIHFGKPFLETLAAIIAGIVLGTLAMKTRSIWSGFLIHVSVALSMDLAALWVNDSIPEQFWPVL